MRLRAIFKCLYHGLTPWWVYEKKKHYDCGYWEHLWINICYAWRWMTLQETQDDIKFEKQSEWIYGTCKGRPARKHRKKGNVQFVLWKAGEHGHKEDFWHDFHRDWWERFEKE
jgi:hypothetical protein